MTRADALDLASDLLGKVRSASNPIHIAHSAVMPLQLRSIFTEAEVGDVAAFLAAMKHRTSERDAAFVARGLAALVQRLRASEGPQGTT